LTGFMNTSNLNLNNLIVASDLNSCMRFTIIGQRSSVNG
jgi:hypothetical protein